MKGLNFQWVKWNYFIHYLIFFHQILKFGTLFDKIAFRTFLLIFPIFLTSTFLFFYRLQPYFTRRPLLFRHAYFRFLTRPPQGLRLWLTNFSCFFPFIFQFLNPFHYWPMLSFFVLQLLLDAISYCLHYVLEPAFLLPNSPSSKTIFVRSFK